VAEHLQIFESIRDELDVFRERQANATFAEEERYRFLSHFYSCIFIFSCGRQRENSSERMGGIESQFIQAGFKFLYGFWWW